jgi:ABC-type nitrate/sulfonate/bicarbonate transport system ATPase subunit
MSSGAFALDVSALVVGYSQVPVLRDVALTVKRNEVVALMGPSGCGKTTLIRAVAKLIPVRAGSVEFGFQNTDGLAVMFQAPLLQPWLTIRGNAQMPSRISGKACDVDSVLKSVGLEAYADRYPWQLSGGQQRRAALARALSAIIAVR